MFEWRRSKSEREEEKSTHDSLTQTTAHQPNSEKQSNYEYTTEKKANNNNNNKNNTYVFV